MGSISVRRHIRWEGEKAGEPTSTVVLTSRERRYVDLRILIATGLSELDWAIAGFSSSQRIESPDGHESWHSQWRHWIDSRTKDAEGASDEGFNYPRGDGLTLEKGRMVNPATGRESDYEELWHDPEPARDVDGSEGKADTLVMMWEGAGDQDQRQDQGQDQDREREREQGHQEQRGMVVRVGEWCQGLVRDGEGIACERWQWSRAEGGWRMRARIFAGGMEGLLPCQEAIGKRWAVGDEVVKASRTWRVVESDAE